MQKQLTEQFSRSLEPQTLEARQKVRQLLPYVEQFYQSWEPDPAPMWIGFGGVLSDEHIAGMQAFYGPVGYFNLGDSRQVYNVLNAGGIVEVVY